MHNPVKLFLFFVLLTLSTSTLAKQSNSIISLGVFNEPQGERAGLEIAMSAGNDYFGGRLSGTLYKGGKNNGDESSDLYAGFSGFGYIHTGQDINPYIGLGIFIGETLNCTDEEEESNYCSEEMTAALYPELGIKLNIENIQVTPYIRRYFDTSDSRKSGNVYGINFGIAF